jgi:hypothetical protein
MIAAQRSQLLLLSNKFRLKRNQVTEITLDMAANMGLIAKNVS